MTSHHWTLSLGLFFLAFALSGLFLWIPAGIDSGVVERFRGRTEIGDAMAPTVATIGILITAIWMIVDGIRKLKSSSTPDGQEVLDRDSLFFLAMSIINFAVGFVLMVWLGPLIVDLVNASGGDIGSYRQLRDTVPYKYVGFVIGGGIIIFGFISLVERRWSGKLAAISLAAAVVLALIFDLPFEDILLPPNGDQ
jgi:hypothetical protein